jgi:protein involved in polysaccharide export with SLBB domain
MAGTGGTYMRAFSALSLILSLAALARAQDGIDEATRRASSARVRPGDRIGLNFLRERQMSESLFVDERGEAAFPKIGILKVSNMTIAELQDTLRARYSEFLRLPEFQVAVLRRIVVNGEVRIPNVYLMDVASSTVRDAIARAGGITEMGSQSKVSVVRDGQRIPMKNWERDWGPVSDLQSGDQVLVGRKSWIVMNALSVISTAVLVTSFIISVSK